MKKPKKTRLTAEEIRKQKGSEFNAGMGWHSRRPNTTDPREFEQGQRREPRLDYELTDLFKD